MDPMTMLALSSVGVGAVQSVWNYFAGQDQLATRRTRLKDQYAREKAGIQTQYAQGQQDIAVAAGADAAGLAARGIEGAGADAAVAGTQSLRRERLDLWNSQVTASLDANFAAGVEDLDSAGAQLNMDALMNGLGVGLSAAGTLVDAGVFNKKSRRKQENEQPIPFSLPPGGFDLRKSSPDWSTWPFER